ncbi:ankyrin repeat domain-containing protein [Pyxidicoccus xibeiensis]|uniref:ankyrin repeat domain-containing protein n=1 Tax=Pyxidicoccus xibeiensis TaxID=2906759 RepID=UPI0020A7AAF7|nr:ankyrin repeat domain-containing protein [Pyxidicoccus xibeiensis]MCP3144670.1 ankyrin repeat domain-containing protein [Pyxidicoccus xibeiensis]
MSPSLHVRLRRTVLALLRCALLLGAPGAFATSGYERAVELTTAVSSGDATHMERLLDAGHDVNSRTSDNSTTLHAAAGYGRLDMVRRLLEKGADPLLEDDAGRTARDIARDWGHTDVVALLEVAERSQSRLLLRAHHHEPPPRLQRGVEPRTAMAWSAPTRPAARREAGTTTRQLAPRELRPTGVSPRGGMWTGRFAHGTGRVRFTLDSSGRTLSGVELEGTLRCAGGDTARASGRGATFVIDRGAFNGTFHDVKAGVQWHVEGHFLATGNAVGQVRVRTRTGTCDTGPLRWTASP